MASVSATKRSFPSDNESDDDSLPTPPKRRWFQRYKDDIEEQQGAREEHRLDVASVSDGEHHVSPVVQSATKRSFPTDNDSDNETRPISPKRRRAQHSELDILEQLQGASEMMDIQEQEEDVSDVVQVLPVRRADTKTLKFCDICHLSITRKNWARHTGSGAHQAAWIQKQQLNRPSVIVQPSIIVRPSIIVQVPRKPPPPPNLEIIQSKTAFRGRMKTFEINNVKVNGYKSVETFIEDSKKLIIEKVRDEGTSLKIQLILKAKFAKGITEKVESDFEFKTKNIIIYEDSNLSDLLNEAKQKLLTEMESFNHKGSNWNMKTIECLLLHINRLKPLKGSSYIALPEKIRLKRAVVNIKNNDQRCFMWCCLAALHPSKVHPERIESYTAYVDGFLELFDGIDFPVKLTDVKKFEKRAGLSINVYGLEENSDVFPLCVTDEEKPVHVDLLLVKDGTNSHYCLIKNLSRLVHSQATKHNRKCYICRRCLQHFHNEDNLKTHMEDCSRHDPLKIKLPTAGKNDKIRFTEHNKSMKVPYVIYADLESMLLPISTCEPSGVDENGAKRSYTYSYQKHEAISFCYYISGSEKPPTTYFGEDAGRKFVEVLKKEAVEIKQIYEKIIPMKPLEEEEIRRHKEAVTCHICQEPLNETDKVRDHDHLTGLYRGPAHSKCNLLFTKPKFIPVFLHNLSGYDIHQFIKEIGRQGEKLKVIPQNDERYISFTVQVRGGLELRFLDSFKFLSASLDQLINNLTTDQLEHTKRFVRSSQIELVTRKGVYPYDFMDNITKYDMTTLPELHDFKNKLNKCDVSESDYEHAQKVWNEFNIKDMREYTLFYNKIDVLQLADVMDNFRDVCLQTYSLDPAWYFTAPGLAWSAMLKLTDVELQLLTDLDMILMVEKGIRGGVSQCCLRQARANNKYMSQGFDENKEPSYLVYLDANNLYAWAMSQAMPFGDFRWRKDTEINVLDISDDAATGYILEVDLEYPEEIHDHHADFPLAPHHMIPPGSKIPKLVTTLYDRSRYVVHYRNLKQYLNLGMKLKNIHRVLEFSQKPWMKPYIDLNTNMRTKAKNKFEIDFYKLMNNAVFGKTMENLRNRVDVRLVTDERQADKFIAKPTFKSRKIFTDHLAAVHMTKTSLLFNKPIYVGAAILDVSKTLIYRFHYQVMKSRYGDRVILTYTDTDSLIYIIYTEDWYMDMKEMIDEFDTSAYQSSNPFGMPRVNKKVLGKMKDELEGLIKVEYVGLKSKMYATDVEEGLNCIKTSKKAKGIKKSVVENEITIDDYRRCLKTLEDVYRQINSIRSHLHDVYSMTQFKKSLSPKDDKRCVLRDGIRTLPWGHRRIPTECT
ncbi:uncharacterized protein LOC128981938 [Macrosteles quadrilineatus]|uniref:uncharacterized protein LOC128981938 n=1 Tax=Macrosteles quadrilineatus TaxID=74068 RepID=UPI0023E0F1A9|nr:uncharacterized protein LOC128981938 [Macrosteles quadrilineatus]